MFSSLLSLVLVTAFGVTTTAEPEISESQRQALVAELRQKNLVMPVAGVKPEDLKGSFSQKRGERTHNAADVMAPRNTPVLAVDDGILARLFTSKAGGLTIYQTDLKGRFVYYYAHLESYAPNLIRGQRLKKGQVIGYVGSSGNANPEAPHVHLTIWHTTPDKIFSGSALDPFEVYSGASVLPFALYMPFNTSPNPAPDPLPAATPNPTGTPPSLTPPTPPSNGPAPSRPSTSAFEFPIWI